MLIDGCGGCFFVCLFFSVGSAPVFQLGLQERLLSEGWGEVSLHIREHPLQQDPQGLLERPATQDVHGGTECHPDVGPPQTPLALWVLWPRRVETPTQGS